MKMKQQIALIIALAFLSPVQTWADEQKRTEADAKTEQERLELPPPPKIDTEKRFNIDFPGGTPQQFVTAVEKASGKQLNVFIDNEHKDFQMPPLKMRNVAVSQLFQGLLRISRKTENRIAGYEQGRPRYATYNTSYGFMSSDNKPTENSIWYFHREAPVDIPPYEDPKPKPGVRFWNLGHFLDTFKVEDITTAVETGWKMQGTTPTPKLSFHKDTKLLIAVGYHDELEMVDQVLRQLQTSARKGPGDGNTGPAKH